MLRCFRCGFDGCRCVTPRRFPLPIADGIPEERSARWRKREARRRKRQRRAERLREAREEHVARGARLRILAELRSWGVETPPT